MQHGSTASLQKFLPPPRLLGRKKVKTFAGHRQWRLCRSSVEKQEKQSDARPRGCGGAWSMTLQWLWRIIALQMVVSGSFRLRSFSPSCFWGSKPSTPARSAGVRNCHKVKYFRRNTVLLTALVLLPPWEFEWLTPVQSLRSSTKTPWELSK